MTHRDLGFDYSFGSGNGEKKLFLRGFAKNMDAAPPNVEADEYILKQRELESMQAEKILKYVASLLKNNVAPTLLTEEFINKEKEEEGYLGIPAGYTYLYQFAAHDMTHSSLEPQPLGDPSHPQTDLRRGALTLETLFGGGPMGCRHAYDMENSEGAYPLRLGQFRDPYDRCARREPSRDLPRAYFSENNHPHPSCWMSDVLIADTRNDDNNLLAQMTVLFTRLYNALVKETETIELKRTQKKIPIHSRAILARLATIQIYRRILREDLVGRLIQEDVCYDYLENSKAYLRRPTDPPISREFRFAASRLAHSMVRPSYFLNAPGKADRIGEVVLKSILNMSSLHVSGSPPTPRDWMIDWEFFFQIEEKPVPAEQFNWALKFSPFVAQVMTHPEAGQPLEAGYPSGVSMRDFVRANLGETEPVGDLIERAWRNGARFKNLEYVRDPQNRHDLVQDGIAALDAATTANQLGTNDQQVLVANPPLLLYLMIEAKHFANGRTYGPLGSILVGDAFLPVFKDLDPKNDIARDAADLETAVFHKEISTMPELVMCLDTIADSVG